MTRFLFAIALLLASASLRAETNVCTTITQGQLPITISTPGVYCLTDDLTFAQQFAFAINIEAADVVLDCNSHSITGTTPVPPFLNYNGGILLNGGARTSVRNCRLIGFDWAIQLGGEGTPADATVEDNRLSGPGEGIVGWASGVTNIRRNAVLNSVYRGVNLAAIDGTMDVSANFVSRSGDNAVAEGHGGQFETYGTNPRIFVRGNVFAEVQSPGGEVEEADAVVFVTEDSNVDIEDNVITAPAIDYDKGYITQGVRNDGTGQCRGNVTANYPGEANNPGCLDAFNRLH